jgi:hypothetical protein
MMVLHAEHEVAFAYLAFIRTIGPTVTLPGILVLVHGVADEWNESQPLR